MCSKSSCVCTEGFHGADCSVRNCPSNSVKNWCSGNGLCSNGKCECHDGFSGADCAVRACPNDCSGHGACNAMTGKCDCTACKSCPIKYGGEDCSLKVCPNNCNGHGKCAQGVCQCDAGFTGAQTDDCSIRTCSGGGGFGAGGADFCI